MSSEICPIFYFYLENDKVTSLRLNKGVSNFGALAKVSPGRKQKLEWWLENNGNIEQINALLPGGLKYFCYLSSYSWSASFDTRKIGGAWNMKEKALYINCKE